MKNLPLKVHIPKGDKQVVTLVPIGNIHSIREVTDEKDLSYGFKSRIFFLGESEGCISVSDDILDILKQYQHMFEFVQSTKSKFKKGA